MRCDTLFQVREVCGATYMLNQDEELWEKELPPAVEQLLSESRDPLADRSDRCKSKSPTLLKSVQRNLSDAVILLTRGPREGYSVEIDLCNQDNSRPLNWVPEGDKSV